MTLMQLMVDDDDVDDCGDDDAGVDNEEVDDEYCYIYYNFCFPFYCHYGYIDHVFDGTFMFRVFSMMAEMKMVTKLMFSVFV